MLYNSQLANIMTFIVIIVFTIAGGFLVGDGDRSLFTTQEAVGLNTGFIIGLLFLFGITILFKALRMALAMISTLGSTPTDEEMEASNIHDNHVLMK